MALLLALLVLKICFLPKCNKIFKVPELMKFWKEFLSKLKILKYRAKDIEDWMQWQVYIMCQYDDQNNVTLWMALFYKFFIVIDRF